MKSAERTRGQQRRLEWCLLSAAMLGLVAWLCTADSLGRINHLVQDAGLRWLARPAHPDLKPATQTLCPRTRVVSLDVGTALPESAAKDMDRCGTPRDLAPEIINGSVVPAQVQRVFLSTLNSRERRDDALARAPGSQYS